MRLAGSPSDPRLPLLEPFVPRVPSGCAPRSSVSLPSAPQACSFSPRRVCSGSEAGSGLFRSFRQSGAIPPAPARRPPSLTVTVRQRRGVRRSRAPTALLVFRAAWWSEPELRALSELPRRTEGTYPRLELESWPPNS